MDPRDVNGDALVFADDALILANRLSADLDTELPAVAVTPPFLDVSGDEPTAYSTPLDFFIVSNYLSADTPPRPDLFARSTEGVVGIDLNVTDNNGTPITTANVGDELVVTAVVSDERVAYGGVFGAYFDVLFDPPIVSFLGQIDFGSDFRNGHASGQAGDGSVNDLGAFSHFLPNPNAGPSVLFSTRFRAEAAGDVTFAVDDVDAFAMLFGIGQPVLTRVGTASVHVVPEPVGIGLWGAGLVGFMTRRAKAGRFVN